MDKFATACFAIAASGFLGYSVSNSTQANKINDLKNEVRATGISTKDFKKIEKCAEESSKFFTATPEALIWQKALDSLNMKASVEKAYLEGAQMVRDSIKTAVKTIK